jgi:CheY-like chemotaxis protein
MNSLSPAQVNFLQGKSLLLVEDIEIFHIGMHSACKKMGMEFAGAFTENEALDLFNLDKRFDIILMDIHLGTETLGYDVARKILEIDPKAIIVSFSSSDLQSKRALGEGIMVDHFDKLANPPYLCPAIYKVLYPTSRI